MDSPATDGGPPILDHRVSARRPRACAIVALVWVFALVLWLRLDAVWWLPALMVGLTVPAVIEAWRNDTSGLVLTGQTLSWSSARQSGTVAVADVDHVHFNTRLDFAVSTKLHLVDGTVLRLPIEVVPPYPDLVTALDAAAMRHERHHFSFF
ncbi:hypothetical protein [Marivita sp.]|uniref:hypothetical protein n=1 Tax=Marivita sp. TaxID=2003365 RepID=UPI0025B82294|nr:hypothetical protein [Marivita sp.]